jgi:putative transposase
VPLPTEAQMRRIEPFFPISRGLRRVDDRRVISGIVYVVC